MTRDSQAAAARAALHLAQRASQVVLDALNKRVSPGLTVAEVSERVTVVSGPSGDTYFLDGVEFLWLGKPAITQNDDGTISVDRQWREAPL